MNAFKNLTFYNIHSTLHFLLVITVKTLMEYGRGTPFLKKRRPDGYVGYAHKKQRRESGLLCH